MAVNRAALFVSSFNLKLPNEFTIPTYLRVKLTGVGAYNTIDKQPKISYYLSMINAIKQKYYTYQPGEFLPVRSGGELLNKRDFHKYRLKKILGNPKLALYQFTHYAN